MNTARVGNCGLCCDSCSIFLAKDKPQLRAKLAQELDCSQEQVTCNGCKNVTDSCWGAHCKIRLCSDNRGHSSCNDCVERPCSKLRKLSLGYQGIPEQQLEELEIMGEDQFTKLMEHRWTCKCGQPISTYSGKCLGCGNTLELV